MKTIVFQASPFSQKKVSLSNFQDPIEWNIGAHPHHALDYFEPVCVQVPDSIKVKGHLNFRCIDPPPIQGTYIQEGYSQNQPVSVYGSKLLTHIEWVPDVQSFDQDCSIEPLKSSISFAYQTHHVSITKFEDQNIFKETQSNLKPIYAWGGVFKEHYSLQQIYPAYFSLTCKPGVSLIEFFKKIDSSYYQTVGTNHPDSVQWGHESSSLHHYIEHGGFHIRAKMPLGEHTYISQKVDSYNPNTYDINLLFTLKN